MNLFSSNLTSMKRTVIVDCDEVLVETSPRAIQLMHEDYDFYSTFLRLPETLDLPKMTPLINTRPTYYLNEWLMKKEIVETDLYDRYMEELLPKMMEMFARKDFYDPLRPTRLGITLMRLLRNRTIAKVIIISKVTKYDKDGIDSKNRFLKNLFSGLMDRVDIYYLPSNGGGDKSDVIKSLPKSTLDDVAFFADDHIPNIVDVLEKTDLVNYQLLVPAYGYNNDISSISALSLRSKQAELKFYSPLVEEGGYDG